MNMNRGTFLGSSPLFGIRNSDSNVLEVMPLRELDGVTNKGSGGGAPFPVREISSSGHRIGFRAYVRMTERTTADYYVIRCRLL